MFCCHGKIISLELFLLVQCICSSCGFCNNASWENRKGQLGAVGKLVSIKMFGNFLLFSFFKKKQTRNNTYSSENTTQQVKINNKNIEVKSTTCLHHLKCKTASGSKVQRGTKQACKKKERKQSSGNTAD